jgi:hypothetical protein
MATTFDPPIFQRRRRQSSKASRTAGSSKGECCTSRGPKKFYASHPHAYMDKNYAAWHAKFVKINKGGS